MPRQAARPRPKASSIVAPATGIPRYPTSTDCAVTILFVQHTIDHFTHELPLNAGFRPRETLGERLFHGDRALLLLQEILDRLALQPSCDVSTATSCFQSARHAALVVSSTQAPSMPS